MSASIAERLRRAREGSVEVEGFTFLFHRPTDVQMASLHKEFGGSYDKPTIARRYVFSWKNVMESDLFQGGSETTAVPFDNETFEEWLNDARDYWSPIYEAIMESYVQYSADRGKQVKN